MRDRGLIQFFVMELGMGYLAASCFRMRPASGSWLSLVGEMQKFRLLYDGELHGPHNS